MSKPRPRHAKELRSVISAALRSGWRWEEGRKGGHAIIRSPDGAARIPVPRHGRGHVPDVFRKQMAQHGIIGE